MEKKGKLFKYPVHGAQILVDEIFHFDGIRLTQVQIRFF